jgi:hypothetical protein
MYVYVQTDSPLSVWSKRHTGLNTVQVVTRNNPDGRGQDQNTLEKSAGYSWTCALGGHQTVCEKHVRRFLIHVRKKTGALQIGVSDLTPPKQSPGIIMSCSTTQSKSNVRRYHIPSRALLEWLEMGCDAMQCGIITSERKFMVPELTNSSGSVTEDFVASHY